MSLNVFGHCRILMQNNSRLYSFKSSYFTTNNDTLFNYNIQKLLCPAKVGAKPPCCTAEAAALRRRPNFSDTR